MVSIGLASGFVEPLESTSIHLVQMGIAHLLTFFPAGGFAPQDTRPVQPRDADQEYEWVRDFIILHYKATERSDTPFWNYCRTMEMPASLQQRIDLFRTHGRVYREGSELFTKVSWLQVLARPAHPPAGLPPADRPAERRRDPGLPGRGGRRDRGLRRRDAHARQFIADNCAASCGCMS